MKKSKLKVKNLIILLAILLILIGGTVFIISLNTNKPTAKLLNSEDISTTIPDESTTSALQDPIEELPTEVIEQTNRITEPKNTTNKPTKAATTVVVPKTPTNHKPTVPTGNIDSSWTMNDLIEAAKGNKRECTSNDADYVNYVNSWKQKNPNYLLFSTKEERDNYGEYASKKFGYDYDGLVPLDSKNASYENDSCIKMFWAVQLYVSENVCNDNGVINPKIYLPATSKESLVDKYTYLRSKGYSCENKVYIPIG